MARVFSTTRFCGLSTAGGALALPIGRARLLASAEVVQKRQDLHLRDATHPRAGRSSPQEVGRIHAERLRDLTDRAHRHVYLAGLDFLPVASVQPT